MTREQTLEHVRSVAARLDLLLRDGTLKQPLDSLDVVNLYVELETTLSVTIPPEEIAPENFLSVESLAGLLSRLSRAGAA